MKKLIIILSSTPPTVANVIPIGGVQSDPTFNLVCWDLNANLVVPDEKVLFIQNQTPEQGGVAELGGYNYVIFRRKVTMVIGTVSGTFVVGETVTGGTSTHTGKVISTNNSTAMVVGSATGDFKFGETITGGTSGATAVMGLTTTTTYIYATSLKNHPYRTVSSTDTTPLQINADVIDLETCVTAYANELYHTA